MTSASILTSTKKVLGLAEDYTVFDVDVIMHINSTLGTLSQLGLGPEEGLSITDKTTTWGQFLGGEPLIASAQSYMYLCVRLLFDSSSLTGPVLQAMKAQKEEFEWRLMVAADPVPDNDTNVPNPDDLLVIDGGGA